jgi:hypothetical protein
MELTLAPIDASRPTPSEDAVRAKRSKRIMGDPLLEKLSLELQESFTEDADGLAAAHRVAEAAVQALRKTGAAADLISQAAIDAVTPSLREAEQAVTAAEDRL